MAHSLSVIVVQAEGGRAVVLKKPEVGAQVLDTIAETGRSSLIEMRRIVDLLRGGSSDATSFLPSPGWLTSLISSNAPGTDSGCRPAGRRRRSPPSSG